MSDEILTEKFVCDLNKCKGGCCVDGDCGAPLTEEETRKLSYVYPKMKHLLPTPFVEEISKQGTHTVDEEMGYVTPTVNGGICVYGYYNENGIVMCALEKAYQQGIIDFIKPISCHLYPIRVLEKDEYTALNYAPRKKLCAPACKLGNQLKIPVYRFLKNPIERKFGKDFYAELEEVAKAFEAHLSNPLS